MAFRKIDHGVTDVTLCGVWVPGKGSVWAVGGAGTILRYKQGTWFRVESGATADLYSIWGTGRSLWTVGSEGTVLRWNGRRWSHEKTYIGDDLTAIWGFGSEAVYAVGDYSTIIRRDASGWSRLGRLPERVGGEVEECFYLRGVGGSGEEDVVAVGEWGVIYRIGPSQFLKAAGGQGKTLCSIWAHTRDDKWFVGEHGLIVHWDGADWARIDSPVDDKILFHVWGTGPKDVWVVGEGGTVLHWDGSECVRCESGTEDHLFCVHGTGPKDVWVVGTRGTVLHLGR